VFFPIVGLLPWFSNCHKSPPVNRVSQVTIRDLQIAGKGRISGSSKLQLATRAVHNRAAKWVTAGGGIFENLLQTQACLN